MKKIILTALMLLSIGTCANAADDEIIYCDFEEPDAYFQNIDTAYSTYAGLSVDWAEGEGCDGSGALKIDAAEEGSSLLTKLYMDGTINTTLNVSDKYTMMLYARVPEGSDITGIDISYCYNKLTKVIDVPVVSKTIEGTDYVKISASFNITSISRFSVKINPIGTGTVYIDEFSIEKSVFPKMIKGKCFPSDGAVDVMPSNEIFVAFNKAVNIDAANILVNGSAENIKSIVSSDDGAGFTINLIDAMDYEKSYNVDISGVFDDDGIEVVDSFSFATGEKPGEIIGFVDYDEKGPKSIQHWRSNYEITEKNAYKGNSVKVNIEGQDGNYQVLFPMEKGILYKYSLMISSAVSGSSVKIALNNNEKYKILTTASSLPSDGEYKKISGYIYIPTTDNLGETKIGIVGDSGTFYLDDIMLTRESDFSLVADYPEENATNVSVLSPIEMRFNYNISGIGTVLLNGTVLDSSDYEIDGKSIKIYNIGKKAFDFETNYSLEVEKVLDEYGRTVTDIKKNFRTENEFDIASTKIERVGQESILKIKNLANNTTKTRELVLKVIAIKDGVLLKSVQKTVSIPSNQSLDAQLSLDLSDISGSGYKIKGLLWDEESGIMPVMKHVE